MFLLESKIRSFLSSLETIEPIIKIVVDMIPTRELVQESVMLGKYNDHIESINDLIKEGRQGNNLIYGNLRYLVKDYDDSLENEANLKRKLVIFGLLMQNPEEQLELIIKLCRDYRLGKRLLDRKEEFRFLERD